MIFKKETLSKAAPTLTHVKVKYDCGFPNNLFIRGNGAGLSWEKGQPLKNTKPNEWVWESRGPFTLCEFKVLLNDRVYERGDNHLLISGEDFSYTPIF